MLMHTTGTIDILQDHAHLPIAQIVAVSWVLSVAGKRIKKELLGRQVSCDQHQHKLEADSKDVRLDVSIFNSVSRCL